MIEKKDIEKLSELARIEMTDEEIQTFQGDIDAILSYVSEIQSVSAEEKETSLGLVHNVFREDGEPHETALYTEALLEQVPQKEGAHIKVKKIL